MPRLGPILVGLLAMVACSDPPPEAGDRTAEADPLPRVTVDSVVTVPGGTTRIGVLDDEPGMPHERPAFSASVEAFALDRSPVTVARFRRFVDATRHRTQAEIFGDGAVMDPATGAWALVPRAMWQQPVGPRRPAPPDDHPVTQVSHADAEAFCSWDGGRLPTEAEWEHAARGATDDRRPYAWGDALKEGGTIRANTWTGTFPGGDDGADGYRSGTNPVGAFGETPLGLTDMGGNVWEWTASWYRPYPLSGDETAPPVGPSGAPERVQRGGSYLCHPSYCHGFRVSARGHATPESSFAHVGFRCARDLPG
ncbi:MAG: formylglycine-generating enzyme family protein [Bacteroidota bacterium]